MENHTSTAATVTAVPADSKDVCVVGLGYIGLPTASLLAAGGLSVFGVDVVPATIEAVNHGRLHIYEPELKVLLEKAHGSGHLYAGLTPTEADVFIIAVPTPFKNGHVPDVSYVEDATRSIAPYLRPGNLVILESTSPVGTTELVVEWIRELRPDLVLPIRGHNDETEGQLYFAYCPERVLPGHIVRELVENDRIIGGLDLASSERASTFYRQFVRGEVVMTDSRTAELCKLTENSFRDVNIAFANELSLISDKLDVDVWELIALANRHPRVRILNPGPGVGGHCIAVDPWFIVAAAPEEARLIRTARVVNDSKPDYVVNQVLAAAKNREDCTIACLGLSFKANIDDLRESPALEIATRLAETHTGKLLAVEPYISKLPRRLEALGVRLVAGTEEAIASADIIVLLVDHSAFAAVDRGLLSDKVVVDTRGLWR